MTLRRHGVRDHVVGERLLKDSAMLVRKETKKKKKKHIWTACPQMVLQGMAPAGVVAKGRRWWHGGLRACGQGCDRPSCVGSGGGPHAMAVGVVASTSNPSKMTIKRIK